MHMERHIPQKGECYRHFKGNRYQVLAVASHSETAEQLVIYEGLYGEHPVYARPIEQFMSRVDRDKYPDTAQEYRFQMEGEDVDSGGQERNLIMEFLDLDTKEEKVEFLQRERMNMTGDFLSAAAMSLDYVENSEDLDLRYEGLMHYLRTMIRFENRRGR
ncbi:DUF1653 domain-containing protein [Extibacter muris]|uniref:DUF1653 domain-containing protein n=2 Tax=Extibacter muris TaxID=1796622 RepID=A0A4V2WSM5_9FIRM|nr:DUF1653 domain-containing protein [Extibacter muris]